ncbi:hypothetical protein [Paraferrimonas sedimenticola]|uniref:hypothetical protein n=1 Tax=Paraferrimonas sedimenticola TaxID=375674 RepID=UPI001140A1FA|nr:hypothetical protein [Paraferrimonas sedimenticola]
MKKTSHQRRHSSYCNHCRQVTHHRGLEHKHKLHLLLSVLTLGAWLFVWAYLVSQAGECVRCGRSADQDWSDRVGKAYWGFLLRRERPRERANANSARSGKGQFLA